MKDKRFVKEISKEIKDRFNLIATREMKLSLTEDTNYIVDTDTDTILQYGEKFIKWDDSEYPMFKPNEIDMDLIRNSRLMEMLFYVFLEKYKIRKNIEVGSIFQSDERGINGYAGFSYMENGVNKQIRSDLFINESVRLFNLICKLNKTDHLYKRRIEMFDLVELPKKKDGK